MGGTTEQYAGALLAIMLLDGLESRDLLQTFLRARTYTIEGTNFLFLTP